VSEHLTAKQVEAIERHIDAGICDCAHRYNITVLCREWRSQTADLAKARADLAAAREREERMREALGEVRNLMSESLGVAGLHLNGAVAEWDWVLQSWLPTVAALAAANITKDGEGS
jgi:hypothetical protein